MAGFRDWIRKANEPAVPAAPTPVADAGEMVDGEVMAPVKDDDHFRRLRLEEIRDVCDQALKEEGPVDWWDTANTLLSLAEDLMEEMEIEFEAGEV